MAYQYTPMPQQAPQGQPQAPQQGQGMAQQPQPSTVPQGASMGIPGQSQPAPQPARDPLLPQTTLSIDEELALMKRQFSEQDKKIEEKQDLFAPKVADDPSIQQDNVNDWLTPVSSDLNVPTTMSADRDSEHYKHFEENFPEDPAVQAIAPDALVMAQQLRKMMADDPSFTHSKAMEVAAKTLDKYASGTFAEHHGDETKPRSLIHSDVLNGVHKMGVR